MDHYTGLDFRGDDRAVGGNHTERRKESVPVLITAAIASTAILALIAISRPTAEQPPESFNPGTWVRDVQHTFDRARADDPPAL